MHPDRETVDLFIYLIDGTLDKPQLIRVWEDDESKQSKPHTLFGTIDKLWDQLVDYNSKGWGVHIGVNEGDGLNHKDADIKSIRAFVADDDTGLVVVPNLVPSIVIASKRGKHFWFVAKPNESVSDYENTQRALNHTLGTDEAKCKPSMLLRMPGFLHQKDPANPFFVELLTGNETQFSGPELWHGLGLRPVPAPPISDDIDLDTCERRLEACDGSERVSQYQRFATKCDPAIQGQGGRNRTLGMLHALRGFGITDPDLAMEAIGHWNQSCAPSWDEKELRYMLRSLPAKEVEGQRLWDAVDQSKFKKPDDFKARDVTFEEQIEELAFAKAKAAPSVLVPPPIRAIEKAESEAPPVLDWVNNWLKSENVWFERFGFVSELRDSQKLLNKAYVDGAKFRFSKERISQVWSYLVDEAELASQRDLRQWACYKNFTHDYVAEWVTLISGQSDLVATAVIRQWVWSVKRKIHNLPVTWHNMPIFTGPQGTGKSTAIKKLVEAGYLKPWVEPDATFEMIGDTREANSLARPYILVFDEMQRADKADMNAVKNLITCDTRRFRPMGTNLSVWRQFNGSLIGTANGDVIDIYSDTTGMRRFFEIKVLDKPSYEAVNNFDYEALWLSVDHNAPAPYLAHENEIKARQELIRVKDDIEQWYADKCEPLLPTAPLTEWTLARDAYNSYRNWCLYQNRYLATQNKFGRRMRGLATKRGSDSKTPRYAIRLIASESN